MSDHLPNGLSEQLLERIRAEFLEMPGLLLTHSQAQRLWGLERETCADVLETLVADRFLRLRGDVYSRLTEGDPRPHAHVHAHASPP